MSLAAVARLSRRHLPVLMCPSFLGGGRTAARAHEFGRISSPASGYCHGRPLPCPPHQLGGLPLPAPRHTPQRFLSTGLSSTDGFTPEDYTKMVKNFASIVRFSCHGEGQMASAKELGAAAAVLHSNLRLLKKRALIFMAAILAIVLTVNVELTRLSRCHRKEDANTSKYKAKLCSVEDKKRRNKLKDLELQKRAVELVSK